MITGPSRFIGVAGGPGSAPPALRAWGAHAHGISQTGGEGDVSGPASVGPALPTRVAGDILVATAMFVTNGTDQAWEIIDPGSSGWTRFADYDPGFTYRVVAYWRRATGTSSDNGFACQGRYGTSFVDGYARMMSYSGCVASGSPIDGAGADISFNTSMNSAGITTTKANSLVSCFVFAENVGSWANASLANYTERFDNTGVDGGGSSMAAGVKVAPGATSAFTMSRSGANGIVKFGLKGI